MQSRLTPSLALLIFMNIIPVAGVFLFSWDVGTLLLLYWVESVVIGILNVPKMLTARGTEKRGQSRNGSRVFLTGFFIVHFGMFCSGHYVFLDSFFETIPPLPDLILQLLTTQGLLMSAAGLFISHLISMLVNYYGKGEYLTRTVNTQMFIPYGRIFIMHFVIIFGGILVETFGAPVLALLLLILLKTFIDIMAHIAEHKKTRLKPVET